VPEKVLSWFVEVVLVVEPSDNVTAVPPLFVIVPLPAIPPTLSVKFSISTVPPAATVRVPPEVELMKVVAPPFKVAPAPTNVGPV